MIRLGSTGAAVAEVRARLAYLGLCDVDTGDEFDVDLDRAVRTFQQERGITVDGIVGPVTFRNLEEARWKLGDRVLAFSPGHLVTGDDVKELQRRLSQLGFNCGRIDGIFGPDTDRALRDFQLGVGVPSDGTCGPDTYRAFERLVRTVSGGDSSLLREQLGLGSLQTGIADKVVLLDPGSDVEPDLCFAIVSRTEGRLAALGTQVLISRPAHIDNATPTETERADFANRLSADLVLSIHISTSLNPLVNGVSSFYFGDPLGGAHSLAGKALATLTQEELVSRTDLLDCRTHARSWDLLRSTRMPAVRIELGYISNPADAKRLGSANFHDAVAEGLAAALTQICAPA
jgi:N-acetylmuramoyl-L-alanine amidase